MFNKPYKLKSNTTLKNSEKKLLVQRIQNEFPSNTEEKVKELVPVKSSCICMKLILHSGDTVNVYAVDSVPMIIEREERLLPTVCALWKVPDLVPILIIHSPVLPKILGGAPLYLPGVVTPAGGVGFPVFQRNAIVALCTQDNVAVCTVGRALMSSADMLLKAAGVCLETLQVFGDHLCKDNKFNKIERPKMGVAFYSQEDVADIIKDVCQLSINRSIKEEWPSLGKQLPASAPQILSQETSPCTTSTPTVTVPNEPRLIVDNELGTHPEQSSEQEESIITEPSSQTADLDLPNDVDGLLRWCLLTFLKLHAKNHEYPFKTNLLYKCLMQLCPPNRTIDVKKSSYKKVGKFLEVMQQEGLLEVRELEKGVWAVTAVQPAHPAVRAHSGVAGRPLTGPAGPPPSGPHYVPPVVREVYCVTAAVADLFAPIKKGTPLTSAEVRAHLTEYVKLRNLHSTEVKGAVKLDATLSKITGKSEGESLKWDLLMSSAQGRMTPSTEMRFSDGTVKLTKTKLEPVRMQIANRSGNKKVTLISNLEAFGFNLAALSHVCQTGVAASCGVTRSPGSKCDQLMIQGDQTHFVAKLLIEKYGLPKKYVEGADKALNKKK